MNTLHKSILVSAVILASVYNVGASRPLYYIDCDIEGTITNVEFLKPEIDDCVTDNTFGCGVILGSGYSGPAKSSHYALSIDRKKNTCHNLDTDERFQGELGIRNNIRLYRYNTWDQLKIGDSIAGTVDTFGYMSNIRVNDKQEKTYGEQGAPSGDIIEKLEKKHKDYAWESPTGVKGNTKVEEIHDKLRVFALRLPEEKLEAYIKATERMLKNPRFQTIQEEIELLRYYLYTW